MKKITRSSSFCMCFDPVVMEDGSVFEPKEPSVAVKAVLSSPALDMMTSDDKDTDVLGSFSRKNKTGRRSSFSRYVKAVFFETSLMKKMREKKSERKLHKSLNSVKTKSKKKSKIAQSKDDRNVSSELNQKPCSHEEDNHSTSNCSTLSSGFGSTSNETSTNSASSSTTTSRCSSSSRSFNSRSSSSSEGPKNNTGINKFGCNVGIFLFLISLLVLVLWGKLCAILCTSTWLFFAFHRSLKLASSGSNAADHHHQFPNIDTEKYDKKKVIMEGLLERNHSRSCRRPY